MRDIAHTSLVEIVAGERRWGVVCLCVKVNFFCFVKPAINRVNSETNRKYSCRLENRLNQLTLVDKPRFHLVQVLVPVSNVATVF